VTPRPLAAAALVLLLGACTSSSRGAAGPSCPGVDPPSRTPDAAFEAVDAIAIVTTVGAATEPDPCVEVTTDVRAERIDLSPWPDGRPLEIVEPVGVGRRLASLEPGTRAVVLLQDTAPGDTDPEGRWVAWAVAPLDGDRVLGSGDPFVDDMVSRASGGTDDVRRFEGWLGTRGVAQATLADPAQATLNLTVANLGLVEADDLAVQRLTVAVDGTIVFDHGVPGTSTGVVTLGLVLEPGHHIVQTRAEAGAVGLLQVDLGPEPKSVALTFTGFGGPPEGTWSLVLEDEDGDEIEETGP
jgi:hypothetical protein